MHLLKVSLTGYDAAYPMNTRLTVTTSRWRWIMTSKMLFGLPTLVFYNTANVGPLETYLTSKKLPIEVTDENTGVLRDVWMRLIRKNAPELNFQMIMRLAD